MLCCPRDMGTEMADWLRAIKNKVTREVISRKLISGEPIDKSVTPIPRCLIEKLNAAYARCGDGESAKRKFAIGQTHRSAGRAGESAFQTFDSLEWSPEEHCMFIQVGQSKVSKVKICAMVSGANRHICFFMDMADYLATTVLATYKQDVSTFLFPGMQDAQCGAKVLSIVYMGVDKYYTHVALWYIAICYEHTTWV